MHMISLIDQYCYLRIARLAVSTNFDFFRSVLLMIHFRIRKV